MSILFLYLHKILYPEDDTMKTSNIIKVSHYLSKYICITFTSFSTLYLNKIPYTSWIWWPDEFHLKLQSENRRQRLCLAAPSTLHFTSRRSVQRNALYPWTQVTGTLTFHHKFLWWLVAQQNLRSATTSKIRSMYCGVEAAVCVFTSK